MDPEFAFARRSFALRTVVMLTSTSPKPAPLWCPAIILPSIIVNDHDHGDAGGAEAQEEPGRRRLKDPEFGS